MQYGYIKPKLFILGNKRFQDLSELYEVRHANQKAIIEQTGFSGDIGEYFTRIDFQPDILFITDESLPPMYRGLENLTIPVVGYLIDTHLHFSWHKHFAHVFDHCFIAQKKYFQDISSTCSHCSLLSLFAPGDMSTNVSRDIDICFLGTLNAKLNPERVKFIESFKQLHPLTVASGPYKELFNRSRIILNQAVIDDINFRVFEAMACGGMLLTDSIGNGLNEMFIDGTHLVLYEKGNASDAVNKAIHYLANEQSRQRIALAGHLQTVCRHTEKNRILTVHKEFQKLLASGKTDMVSRVIALKQTYTALVSIFDHSLDKMALKELYNLLNEELICKSALNEGLAAKGTSI